MTKLAGKVLVSGWPLLPEAEKLLCGAGLEVYATKPAPDQAEMVRSLREIAPDALIVRTGIVDRECFDAAPGLKVVANHGAGYDDIDVAEATHRGIPVFAAPGRNAVSVAEHVFAMLLAIRKQLLHHDQLVRSGGWRPSKPMTAELCGLTLGIIGFGAIGDAVAKLACAFGMSIVAFDPGRIHPWPDNVQRCASLDDLYASADAISLHVPLTDQTRHLIDADAIRKMRPGTILINAARGGVVDEKALCAALDSGKLSGAGLDTFEIEPTCRDTATVQHERIILTPHIAGVTPESALRMSMCCAQNVVTCLSGSLNSEDLVNAEYSSR